jgi:hypothetical protein
MFDGRETRNRQDDLSTNNKCLMEEKQETGRMPVPQIKNV